MGFGRKSNVRGDEDKDIERGRDRGYELCVVEKLKLRSF